MMAKAAHLALQNHNIPPREYMAMPVPDRAFMFASDLITAEKTKSTINT